MKGLATMTQLLAKGVSATEVFKTTRKYKCPGRRGSIAEINEIRQERAQTRPTRLSRPLYGRLEDRILARFEPEIIRRGGETVIRGDNHNYHLKLTSRKDGLYLLTAAGWRHYSNSFGSRYVRLVYLCGTDDAGLWATRVVSTVETVAGALDSLTPSVVKKAQAAGKQVLRQGDLYVYEVRPSSDTPSQVFEWSHIWDADTRILEHRSQDGRNHEPLHVPFPARFAFQTALGIGRGWGRGPGD